MFRRFRPACDITLSALETSVGIQWRNAKLACTVLYGTVGTTVAFTTNLRRIDFGENAVRSRGHLVLELRCGACRGAVLVLVDQFKGTFVHVKGSAFGGATRELVDVQGAPRMAIKCRNGDWDVVAIDQTDVVELLARGDECEFSETVGNFSLG